VQTFWPDSAAARDDLVLSLRSPRPDHDPWRPLNVLVEDEPGPDGTLAHVAAIFLAGRECPWRCAMCDLWQQTTVGDTPGGAIPSQIASALKDVRRRHLDRPPRVVKLYNAGSFFDPRAVPESDYQPIADQLTDFDRVIVESHPALIGARVDAFEQALDDASDARGASPALEVAMGLETAHPDALERLNKRITVDAFANAAANLAARGVALRVFVLIAPPFVPAGEQDEWLFNSLSVALECGATAISLIPTRAGNGTVEALAAQGLFRAPTLDDIDRAATLAMGHVSHRARLFVDLWDLERFDACPACAAARRERLAAMNLQQQLLDPIVCADCQ
jgi:archaeosine synthase beta-subunit